VSESLPRWDSCWQACAISRSCSWLFARIMTQCCGAPDCKSLVRGRWYIYCMMKQI
jgi:hypothetical protein